MAGSGKLGAWSPDGAQPLTTGPEEFPTWSITLSVPEGKLEYKFIAAPLSSCHVTAAR